MVAAGHSMAAHIKKNVDEIIRRMASLARLKFPEKELPLYAAKAQAILTYMEQLADLSTEGIEPTSHGTLSTTMGLRDDVVVPSQLAAALLALAPERQENLVEVPKVIDA